MAIPVQALLIGVDVSKATLAICLGPDQPVQTLDNDRNSIARWLAALPAGPVCIAAEATNTFHLDLVDLAHHAGHAVYLVDGYRLSRYRDSIGTRHPCAGIRREFKCSIWWSCYASCSPNDG